jgi:hypothetical protein
MGVAVSQLSGVAESAGGVNIVIAMATTRTAKPHRPARRRDRRTPGAPPEAADAGLATGGRRWKFIGTAFSS